jgi:alanyl-tRNA synthetase
MTRRLYYDDALAIAFSARILHRLTYNQQPAVILDQTYFYPTGGGQPCDHGWLNDVAVVDVVADEASDNIVHVLAGELVGEIVQGRIDWARRFDHMQQHTGQHILSQAFLLAAEAETVSFHLGEESVTIDLNTPRLAPIEVERAEALANKVVFDNVPVRARFVSTKELAAQPLRRPPTVSGPIRIVEVVGFDATPCGGTHVSHTGQVGMVKVIKLERRGEETRVEFRCGGRALADYGRKNQVIAQLAARLTTGHFELDQAVERMQADIKQLNRQLREAQERLADYEAADWIAQAERIGDIAVVRRAFTDRDPGQLRQLAQRLTARPRAVALLGCAGLKSHILCARSDDVDADMVIAVKAALHALGAASGGGRPNFAQGGGPAADAAQIEAALEQALKTIVGSG